MRCGSESGRGLKHILPLALILILVLAGMGGSPGYAQGPGEVYLVKDINPGSDTSDPRWPTAVDGTFFFISMRNR